MPARFSSLKAVVTWEQDEPCAISSELAALSICGASIVHSSDPSLSPLPVNWSNIDLPAKIGMYNSRVTIGITEVVSRLSHRTTLFIPIADRTNGHSLLSSSSQTLLFELLSGADLSILL